MTHITPKEAGREDGRMKMEMLIAAKADPDVANFEDGFRGFNRLSSREKWQRWKSLEGVSWKCPGCKSEIDGPQSPGIMDGTSICCGECEHELTRRTPGGQSNPFEWVAAKKLPRRRGRVLTQ